MGRNQRSWKNVLINPRYQMRYIFWLTVPGLLLVAMNSAIFYHYISENYEILVDLSPMTDDAKQQLYLELRQIILILAGFSAVFLLFVSVFGIVFSHRTAGPMYHFKKVFDRIGGGQKEERIRLRPSDDFQDVAQSFNAMMDRVGEKPAQR